MMQIININNNFICCYFMLQIIYRRKILSNFNFIMIFYTTFKIKLRKIFSWKNESCKIWLKALHLTSHEFYNLSYLCFYSQSIFHDEKEFPSFPRYNEIIRFSSNNANPFLSQKYLILSSNERFYKNRLNVR